MLFHSSFFMTFIAYTSALANGKPMFGSNDRNPRFAGAGAASSLSYVVSIMKGDTAETSIWICQGVIIAPNVTITAASCLYDVDNDVFLPKENIFIQTGVKKGIVDPLPIGVKEVVIYPGFRYYPNSRQFGQDLAMLIPSSNFATSSVVALAQKKANNTKDMTDSGDMASWGNTVDVDGNIVDGEETLKGTSSMYIKNQKNCEIIYASLDFPYELTASSLCLNHTFDQGVCKGDAGAGLFFKDTAKKPPAPYLLAIASDVRTEDCPPKYPSVLTRIAPFLGWISTKTGQKVK